MLRSRIIGTGRYLPEKVLSNFDLEKMMDTSDEWIRQRTGIHRRHVAEPGIGPSDLGIKAGQKALDNAGVTAEEVDLVLCATITADYHFPSTACLIQKGLGIHQAGVMDLGAACSGFLYGLTVADAFIRTGMAKTVLLVASEVMSARLDYTHRNTAILFGDGAGAVVVRGEEGENGVLSTYLNADGDAYEMLYVPAGGTRQVITPENVNNVQATVEMDGPALYKRAIAAFTEATEETLKRANIHSDAIDIFVPHQANKRIIDTAAQRLGLSEDKIYLNLDRVANTSAASIPIALDEAVEEGRIPPGTMVLLAAFGAGLTWAGAMLRW